MAPETAGPKTFAALRESEISAFACCSRPALTVCGISAFEAGLKKPAARSGEALQHGELPDVRGSREEERRGGGLRAEPDEVGADHHRAPRQPVRPHAAGERDRGPAEEVAGEDEADARRAGAEIVADGPDERDGDERVADHRTGAREPEQSELPFFQRPEATDPTHVSESTP